MNHLKIRDTVLPNSKEDGSHWRIASKRVKDSEKV